MQLQNNLQFRFQNLNFPNDAMNLYEQRQFFNVDEERICKYVIKKDTEAAMHIAKLIRNSFSIMFRKHYLGDSAVDFKGSISYIPVLLEGISCLGTDDNFTYLKGSKKLSKSKDFDLNFFECSLNCRDFMIGTYQSENLDCKWQVANRKSRLQRE
jgi:hypothetical protein